MAQEVRANGVRSRDLEMPISSEEAETATAGHRAAKELGPLTALINSASLFENDDWQSASPQSWDEHIETNLRAPLLLSQIFAKQLPEGEHGNIINIVDQRVLKPTPQFFSYSVSKAGLYWLTTTLAQAHGAATFASMRWGRVPPCAIPANRKPISPASATPPSSNMAPIRQTSAKPCAIFWTADAVTGQMLAVDGGQHLIWQTPDVQVRE